MNSKELQDRLGLTLPGGYLNWMERGYFDANPGSDTYLWVPEAEWVQPIEMPERYVNCDNPIPGLVPFAFTGGGDHWCWNTESQTAGNDFQVLECFHDSQEANVYAPNFPAWFYRVCLDNLQCIGESIEDIEEIRRSLVACSRALSEIGFAEWADHLSRLAVTEPKCHKLKHLKTESIYYDLLSRSEIADIVQVELGEQYLHQTVLWCTSS